MVNQTERNGQFVNCGTCWIFMTNCGNFRQNSRFSSKVAKTKFK